MRKFILLTLGLVLSQGAFAADFDSLAASYDTAQQPEQSDIQGWYSGRCYFASARDQAVAALLASQEDSGSLRILAIGHGNVPEDYYDQMSESALQETESLIASNIGKITPAEIVDGSLTSSYPEGSLQYRIRKTDEELVGRMVLLADAGEMHAGDTFVMCRFFKKVR
jgi:hypothetical protein